MPAKLITKPQDKLTQLIRDVKGRKYSYLRRPHKHIDWPSYDLAQLNEMSDYLILVREIIDEIHRELGAIDQGREGKPPKSCFDKAKAIMMQEYFEVSNRVAAGLVRVFKEKLNIRELLTYKDIERAYENPYVILVLKLLFEKTNGPVQGKESHITGDGTGLPASIKQNYENDKGDEKKMVLYDRMVFMMGAEYKLLSAVEVIEGTGSEKDHIIPLLEETRSLHKGIRTVSYDGAAFTYDIMDYIANDLKASPRILPPVTAVLKTHGCMAKKRMLLDFIHCTQQWLREYHVRSNSESRNSEDKRVFPRPLLKRLDNRRFVEGYAEAYRYNVRKLVYVHYLNGIPVRWLQNRAL